MAESDMPNFSAFCREMLLTGKVKHYDFSVIKEISSSLSHISGNINQVAKRCNTNQSVTTNDVEQLVTETESRIADLIAELEIVRKTNQAIQEDKEKVEQIQSG